MALSKILSAANVKPSRGPDGMTDAEAKAGQMKMGGLLGDFMSQAKSGNLGRDASTALQAFRTISGGEPINDRELLLEHGVTLLQGLPPNSSMAQSAANDLIELLYHDLPHPVGSLAGPNTKYRSADGTGNCIAFPEMGKAGTPYSRTVPAVRPKPPSLPDPSLVFDMLMRRDAFRPHPSGLSSFFFAFATCVIHECFQTNSKTWWINETSSYVDLSTLYGNSQKEQDGVRTRNGYGTLWPDTIASARIMLMPPAVVAVLMLFNRNHNFVADKLMDVNESGWYKSDLAGLSPEAIAKQDEDIFQLSRNITVALFAKAVLGDYVAAILNTHRSNSDWSLDLGGEIRKKDGHRVERGGGNIVSIEFNALYHWHASMSEKDAKWTEDVFQAHFPNKKVADLTPEEFHAVVGGFARKFGSQSPREWTIRGLTRGPDGRYPDAALADLIKDAVDQPAAAFGARGTPEAMKVVEVMALKMSREAWNLCTMNEFRKYLNLTPFKEFKEWNSDEKVWRAAELLYGHVDNLELLPGLAAETTKPAMPGSGVCVGHTIGRGILDDAVSLVRSDRFLTHDFNTSTLTSWGVTFLGSCPVAGGGVLGSVMFNALPFAFGFNSTYIMLPFYTPKAAREILLGNNKFDKYTSDRGDSDAQLQSILSYKACESALKDRDTFRAFYNDNIKKVARKHGFFLGFDDQTRHDPAAHLMAKAFFNESFEKEIGDFITSHADYHIKKNSLPFVQSKARQLDIIRDVINHVSYEWIADRWGIPLKTAETPRGFMSVFELRKLLLTNFQYTWFGLIPKELFHLTDASNEAYNKLWEIVTMRLNTASGFKDAAIDWFSKGSSYEDSDESEAMYQTLMKTGASVEELAANCIGLMNVIAGMVPNQTSLLVDLYLKPQYAREHARICQLVHMNTAQADAELSGFIREGIRLAPSVAGLPRLCASDVGVADGERKVSLRAGDRVLIGISKANMDPTVFPNPTRVDPNRPSTAYLGYGLGLHHCFGEQLASTAMLAFVKTIFKLDGLRRGPGRGGQLNTITTNVGGLEFVTYLDHLSTDQISASNLNVQYDAPSVDAPTGSEAVAGITFVRKKGKGPTKSQSGTMGKSAMKTKCNQNTPIASNGLTTSPLGSPQPAVARDDYTDATNGVQHMNGTNGATSGANGSSREAKEVVTSQPTNAAETKPNTIGKMFRRMSKRMSNNNTSQGSGTTTQ